MRTRRIFICLALAALVALPVLAQGNPTSRVAGTVTSADGQPLPGCTVTFASPNLQGTRVTVTDGNGQYGSPPMAPGEYEITFQLEGFQTVTQRTRLSAAMSMTVNATLDLSTVAEEIVVMGEATEQISESTTAAETITREDLEALPIDRTFNSAVALAAGVHQTGPNGGITISGAQSWENLFLLNGVTLNENVRGQAFTLFIEDAIQETTTATSGVSAEYGRFTGGVVNAITKSGGNQFSGSFRVSFDNQDWTANTPLTVRKTDEINETFEATFGGPILRDRIWFFLAGRNRDTENTAQTRRFNIPYVTPREQDRTEGKLTFALTKSHQVQASALSIDDFQGNNAHGGLTSFTIVIDDGSIVDRETPQDLITANYTGIITPDFFLEAQYSEREFTFEGSGGLDQDLFTGTPIWDIGPSYIYNESLFCGSCRDEERDNENALIKGSYFASTSGSGSHDIVFGYDTFDDIRAADNHQSPNDLMIWNFAGSVFDDANARVFPVFAPGATLIEWLPILSPTEGTSFTTNSIFINDRWRLNDNWTFNLGLRYDENDGQNSVGQTVTSSDEISPRLGLTYRPSLNSPWQFNASAGRYVGAIANTVANGSSPGGVPAQFEFVYFGPPVNVGATPGTALTSPQALEILYGWFFDQCPDFATNPSNCPFFIGADIPGLNTIVGDNLSSVAGDEFTIGFQRQLGTRGSLRVDYVYRDWNNFFATANAPGQQVDDGFGNTFDLGVIVNEDNRLERRYDGLNLIFRYNLMNSKLRLGGNYTWSHSRGTFNGETGGSGPVTADILSYQEYKEDRWNNPRGPLGIDQRHKVRAWAIYDIFRNNRHSLNVSWLENFFSGENYSATDTINTTDNITNPGYVSPDTTVTYFFSPRGAFELDDIHRSDLSFNYAINFGRFEFFVQPEITNVFDEDAVDGVDSDVNVLTNFNPFTTIPVEGVDWEKGDDFGQPQSPGDFQTPRTFELSVGFRF